MTSFKASLPLWHFCLLAWIIALVPSVLLITSVLALLVAFGENIQNLNLPDVSPTLAELFGNVVFSPVIETLLLAAIISLLSKISTRNRVLTAISALIWGLLHAAFSPLWFFGVIWSFVVFSYAYLTWRSVSFKHAFIAAAVPHALVNLTVMLTVFATA